MFPQQSGAHDQPKRPFSVTALGCVYLAVGILGFIFHFQELLARDRFPYDAVVIELTEAAAIVCGDFLLRGENWARLVALGWMAFHVVVSAFHPLRELALHALFCVLIAWILFRPTAGRYFRGARTDG